MTASINWVVIVDITCTHLISSAVLVFAVFTIYCCGSHTYWRLHATPIDQTPHQKWMMHHFIVLVVIKMSSPPTQPNKYHHQLFVVCCLLLFVVWYCFSYCLVLFVTVAAAAAIDYCSCWKCCWCMPLMCAECYCFLCYCVLIALSLNAVDYI